MNKKFIISENTELEALISVLYSEQHIMYELDPICVQKIELSFHFLNKKINSSQEVMYGINTGFGSLCNVQIPTSELGELQKNLMITHAAGVGEYLTTQIVKNMLVLKLINIAKGNSAVSLEVVNRILFLINNQIYPRVHQQGSLGASGDLAPLAELFLPLLGLGDVEFENSITSIDKVYKRFNLQPIVLQAKEALALLNGTQFMLAHGIHFIYETERIFDQLQWVSFASLEAFLCKIEPFHPNLHKVRPHIGQSKIASELYTQLAQSPNAQMARNQVQDPYSFRCIPQVHGASWDAYMHCKSVFLTELNSVTDNPLVFPEENLVLSGGNFHGQPLALALDFLKLALSELGSIAERRIYLFMTGVRNLPAYLSPNPGLDSGYMIAQYSAASLASYNKQLCTPSSADTIMSSNGQEDHVSMGANAALQTKQVVENVKNILAIECMVNCQAMQLQNVGIPATLINYYEKGRNDLDAHTKIPMHILISNSYKALWQ